jgi:tetratricopeptide (TPR) repeat protein
MPPTLPDPNIVNGHLFRLFRKEFVAHYQVPLCSDSFSGFIMVDRDATRHNEEIAEATEWLVDELVPHYASELLGSFKEAARYLQIDEMRIAEGMHRSGINMRYIGQIYYHLTALCKRDAEVDHSARVRFEQRVLAEAAARVVKNDLNAKLRAKMYELRVPLEVPYRRLAVELLNVVFGDTEESQRYWREKVRNDLFAFFSFHVLRSPRVLRNLRARVMLGGNRRMLLARIGRLTGMRFGDDLLERFASTDALLDPSRPLEMSDLREMGVRVKFSNIVLNAQGSFFQYQALRLAEHGDRHAKAIETLKRAISRYEAALKSDPLNPSVLFNIAKASFKLLELQSQVVRERAGMKRLERIFFPLRDIHTQEALAYYRRAIAADTESVRKLTSYANFLARCRLRTEAEDYFLQALELDPGYKPAIRAYGDFLVDQRSEQGYAFVKLTAPSQNFERLDSSNSLRVVNKSQSTEVPVLPSSSPPSSKASASSSAAGPAAAAVAASSSSSTSTRTTS